MAHTPGPWEVSDKPGVWVGPVIKANHGTRGVAFVCGESDANARLIAAAPELLARLKSMVSGAECECDKGDEEHPLCDICWSRQVIDKAEGRGE